MRRLVIGLGLFRERLSCVRRALKPAPESEA